MHMGYKNACLLIFMHGGVRSSLVIGKRKPPEGGIEKMMDLFFTVLGTKFNPLITQ